MPHPLPENVILPLGEEPNTVPLCLTLVKPGRFLMGSEAEKANDDEKPEHVVHLTHAYYIGTYPVTQAEWEAVFPRHDPSHFKCPNLPVENVSWHDIVYGGQQKGPPEAFLTRINRDLAKLAEWAGYTFRLPTEAEWEYAAKGGHLAHHDFDQGSSSADVYPEYAGSDQLKQVGWFKGNNDIGPQPVGRKQGNELGLYDMSGNVYEWCADWYVRDSYTSLKGSETIIDPVGPDGSGFRILRGGDCWESDGACRSTHRFRVVPGYRDNFVGFRLVLAPVRASE